MKKKIEMPRCLFSFSVKWVKSINYFVVIVIVITMTKIVFFANTNNIETGLFKMFIDSANNSLLILLCKFKQWLWLGQFDKNGELYYVCIFGANFYFSTANFTNYRFSNRNFQLQFWKSLNLFRNSIIWNHSELN